MSSKYRSSKLKKRKKIIRIWRISLSVIFVAIIFIGLSFWSRHDSVKITEVEIPDLKYVDEETLRTLVFEELEGTYLGILSRGNSLIFPRDRIKGKALDEFPSLEKIDLDFRNFNKIRVEAKEYEPVARWCGNVGQKEECYLLNRDGYIFIKEPIINVNSLVTFRGNLEGEPLRNNFIDKRSFRSFMIFIEVLRDDLGIEISNVSEGEYPIFIFKTKSGAVILVDREDNINEVINNIKTVIEREGIHREQFENIDYIDLRFGNKVLYKLR